MFEPIYALIAQLGYMELMREAEAERRARQAGPAEAEWPLLGLAGVLLANWLLAR